MTPRGTRRLFYASLIGSLIVGAMVWAGAPESPIVRATPLPTSDDPGVIVTITPELPDFYAIDPAQLAPQPAGTMITTQQLPPRGSGPAAGISFSRIMYHSRDLAGNDVPVSGLFLHPDAAPPPTGWPLIAYGHGTTGVARVCGTSLTPFDPGTPSYSEWVRMMKPLVEQGYAVVATDYQGMGAPGTPSYLIGQIEGQNILDSVRAVHSWRADVDPARTVLWGHSQGGHAVAFAAELADSYAPELRLSGAAILAPVIVPPFPAGLSQAVRSPDHPRLSTGALLLAASWAANYPDLEIDEILTEQGAAAVAAVESACAGDLDRRLAAGTASDYVRLPLSDALLQRLAINTPGNEPPRLPVLLEQGLADTSVLPEATLGYQTALCHFGEHSRLQVYPDDDHDSIVVTSQPAVRQWIADRFADRRPISNCPNYRQAR